MVESSTGKQQQFSSSSLVNNNNQTNSQEESNNAKQAEQLQKMLSTPTHSFGLASLFRNFPLLGDEAVKIEGLKLADKFKEELDKNVSEESTEAFNNHLRLVKRIAYECPIQHISQRFYTLLRDYYNLPISCIQEEQDQVSKFFDNDDAPQVVNQQENLDPVLLKLKESSPEPNLETASNADEDLVKCYDKYANQEVNLRGILDKIFFSTGRINPHFRLLCWFPRYLELYEQSLQSLLWDEAEGGSFSIPEKLYMAIMAVSCYKCEYLIAMLEQEFVLQGGNVKWISHGLKAVDSKIVLFAEVCEIMAFIPWMMSSKHIQYLLHPHDDERHTSGLSVKQILAGSMIMSHYHSLCCFVQGQGIYDEDQMAQVDMEFLEKKRSSGMIFSKDKDDQQTLNSARSNRSCGSSQRSYNTHDCDTVKKLQAISEAEEGDSDASNGEDESPVQLGDEEIFTDVEVNSQVSSDMFAMSGRTGQFTGTSDDEEQKYTSPYKTPYASFKSGENAPGSRFSKHRAGRLQGYQDFKQKIDPWHALEEFNWEDQAYGILSKYIPQGAEAINQLNEHCFEMTQNQYGNSKVNTNPLRQAARMYLMYIHGIRDDAYQYNRVNKILNIPHKVYIKQMMCFPQNVTQQDYENLDQMWPEDKAHLSLIVMEAKRRTELIYITKVMSQCVQL